MIRLSSAAVTKTGRRRNNQDNFMLGGICAELNHDTFAFTCEGKTKAPFFAAVCDGMGGEASGERASYEACAELAGVTGKLTDNFDTNKKLVCNSILRANARLCEVMQSEETGRMGSTVISVLIQGDTLFYTNLGDSRIYLLREDVLKQITKDHTEGQSMLDAGVLSAEQLKTHPSRNKLNRHLGIFPEEMVLECPVYEDIKLKAGDKLLLCSDGVFGVLENEQMTAILSEKIPAEERAAKLVDSAYTNGSKDNMTAMVIDVEKAMPAFMPVVYSAAALGFCALLAFIISGALKHKANAPDRNGATAEPTGSATELPSNTEEATDEPTAGPTEQITEEPTAAPTAEQTSEPTEPPEATAIPTQAVVPTSTPRTTPNPTPAPTQAPVPTETAAPTSEPTQTPAPTPEPTPAPTETLEPTSQPSDAPSGTGN